MRFSQGGTELPPVSLISLLHLGMAFLVLILSLIQWLETRSYHYLLLSLLTLQFASAHVVGFKLARKSKTGTSSLWLIIWSFAVSAVILPLLFDDVLLTSLFILAAIPLFVAGTNHFNRLPAVLFLTFLVAALAILVDLVCPWPDWRLNLKQLHILIVSLAGYLLYIISLLLVDHLYLRSMKHVDRLKMNVATQYALVITIISAASIGIMTGVMIDQIRKAQMNQVGKSFQTIAENFSQLTSVHLEQQVQKLQLLTQQLPIFKISLLSTNSQYKGNRKESQQSLLEKNSWWQNTAADDSRVLEYLNNPVIKTISRFRGHNSFHNDMLLVDGYGGLVASLGKKPDKFYFFDQSWYTNAWNGGLGNVYIGDLSFNEINHIPKLRIVVDIVDHSTNDFIGALSSNYLLKTLLSEMKSFKPDSVNQISLTDNEGRVVASTETDMSVGYSWSGLKQPFINQRNAKGSGWILGNDHNEEAALIGYSKVSPAYNLISAPLDLLGWRVIVSGTRSSALIGVTRSTKMMLMAGLSAIALGVLAAIAAARVITRPIEHLTATAASMSEGHLEHRAQLTGPQELVALSTVFNKLTDQLHQNIRDLRSQTSQLVKAKSDAEAATKLKGEFLAKMSHEIRTPLNAILGFADLLCDSLDNAKHRRHAETIKTSGSDLLDLINDILDMSKIEAGRMELNLKPVALAKLFSDLDRIFSISARDKEITIEMTVSKDFPQYLLLDKIRLRQVLFNLVGNAIKFTEKGVIQCCAIASPTKHPNIWDIDIEVHDTGVGIDPEDYTEIFEIFRQHGKSESNYIDGTGLGLTISKNLVEMMGGKIRVRGEKNKGSCFYIHLPMIKASSIASDIESDTIKDELLHTDILFKPASILIIDDLEVNRDLIKQALDSAPFNIVEASDGYEALKLLNKEIFNLVLLDIRMPKIDGYQTLEKIQNSLDGKQPPIIAITAAGMKDDIAQIKSSGFDNHLIRPFDKNALVQLLAAYLPHEFSRTRIVEDRQTATAVNFDPRTESDWHCPREIEDYLLGTMTSRLQKVLERQSIPDTIKFAKDISATGEQYKIDILSRYGKELEEHAEAFDIHNVEKMLNMYEDILSYKMSS